MTEWELSGTGRRRLRLPLPNLRASRRAGEGSRLDGFGASRNSGTAATTPSTAATAAATGGRGSPAVLFVLPYTEPAGTERHVLTLARELLRRGWRVALVAPPGGLLGDFLAAGIPHYAFPRLEQRPIQGIRAFRRALAQAIEEALAVPSEAAGGGAARAVKSRVEVRVRMGGAADRPVGNPASAAAGRPVQRPASESPKESAQGNAAVRAKRGSEDAAGPAGERPPAAERPPVLIHVHGAHELVLLARTVQRARRLPIVFTVHGYFSARPALDYRLAAWMANRFADRVICVSRSEAERLTASGLRPDKLRVVHNGIKPLAEDRPEPPDDDGAVRPSDKRPALRGADRQEAHRVSLPAGGERESAGATSLDRGGHAGGSLSTGPPSALNRENLGLDPTAVVIGAVGRLEPQKGFDCLIKAFARIVRERSGEERIASAGRRSPQQPLQLALVGSGSQERPLRQLAQAHGLKEGQDVVFLGFRHDARAVMRLFDILAVPSRQEAFPLVVLEAMASGLPVVATDVAGIPEMVADGDTGLLVPPDDPAALAEALQRLATPVSAPALRDQMGRAGRRRFEAEFTAERTATRTVEVYQALLPAPPPARPATPPAAP